MQGFDHFSIIAPYYDKLISNQNIDKIIAFAQLPTSGYLLDIGGGTGRISELLVNLIGQIEVVDLSMGMLRVAKRKGLPSICASAVHLPFINNYFSRILIMDSLHHFEFQELIIKELWRVLELGGILVIGEPNYKHISGKLIRLMEKALFMNSRFLRDDQICLLFKDLTDKIQIQNVSGSSFFIFKK